MYLTAWINLYKIPQVIVNEFIDTYTRRITSDEMVTTTYRLYSNGNISEKDLPPCLKYIKQQEKIVFDPKLFDTTKAMWFYQHDGNNFVSTELLRMISQHCNVDKPWAYCDDLYVPPFRPHLLCSNVVDNKAVLQYRENGKYYTTSIGKGLKKVDWPFSITDSEIERMANILKTVINPDLKLSVVSGEDIRYWYYGERYARNSGSLGNSCMRYSNCQDYFDIYVENDIEMLIATDSLGRLHGRALLWKRSLWNKNYWDDVPYIMDRIYGNDSTIELFKRHARENGWVYKEYQRYDERLSWMYPVGDGVYMSETKRCRINLEYTDYDQYPYVDTFSVMDRDGCALKNFGDGEILTSTDGYVDSSTYSCEDCGNQMNEDEMYHCDGSMYCGDCAVYSETASENFHRDDVTWCEYDQDYVHNNDVTYIDYGRYEDTYTYDSNAQEVYSGMHVTVDDDIKVAEPFNFLSSDDYIEIRTSNQVIHASLNSRFGSDCWNLVKEQFDNDDIVDIKYFIDKEWTGHALLCQSWGNVIDLIDERFFNRQIRIIKNMIYA